MSHPGKLQRAIAAGGAVPLAAAAGGAGGPPALPGGLAAAAQLQAALLQAQSYGLAPQQPPPPPAAMSVAQVQTMLHMLGEQQTQVFLQAQARAQAQQQQQLAQARTPQQANPQTLDWSHRLGSPTHSTWRDGPKGTSEVHHERHQAAAGVGEPRQRQTESLHQVQASHIRARLEVQISALCSDLSLPKSATRAVMAAHLSSSPHGIQPRGDRGKGLSFSPAPTVLAGPAGAAGGGRNDEGPLARGGGVELAAALAEVLRKQKPPSTHMLKKTGTPGRWAVRAPPVGEAVPPSTATTPGEDPPVLTRVRCDSCKVVLQMEVPRGPVKEVRLRCGSCNCLLEVGLPPNFREDLKRLAKARPEEAAPPPAQAARRDTAPISERELEGIGTLLELAGEGASSEETTSDRPLAASRRQQAARAGARRREGKAKKATEIKKDGSPPPRPAVRKGRIREERALARGLATAEVQPAAKKPKPAPETATKELPAKAPTERMGVGEDGGPPRAIRASPEGGGRGGRRAAGAAAPDAAAREAAAEMPNAAPEADAGEAPAEKPKAAPGTAAQESPAEQAKSAPEAAAEAAQVQDPKANIEMNAGGSCPPSPPGTAAVKLKAAEAASSPAAAAAALRRPIQRALNRARPNDVGSAGGSAPPAAQAPQAQAPAHPGPPNPAPQSSDRNDAVKHNPTLTWTPEPEREAGRAPPGRKPSPKQ